MLRSGTIHVISQAEDASGGRIAMTMRDRPGLGVMVWAGLLRPLALGKPADQILPSDYVRRQIVSFSGWRDVWDFYGDHSDFAPLLAEIRGTVDERIASGVNMAGPQS